MGQPMLTPAASVPRRKAGKQEDGAAGLTETLVFTENYLALGIEF